MEGGSAFGKPAIITQVLTSVADSCCTSDLVPRVATIRGAYARQNTSLSEAAFAPLETMSARMASLADKLVTAPSSIMMKNVTL